jgi:hypothetical protein
MHSPPRNNHMKKLRPNKVTKYELRQETRLTRPPRLEGKVKEAMMQPTRKAKQQRIRRARSGGGTSGRTLIAGEDRRFSKGFGID